MWVRPTGFEDNPARPRDTLGTPPSGSARNPCRSVWEFLVQPLQHLTRIRGASAASGPHSLPAPRCEIPAPSPAPPCCRRSPWGSVYFLQPPTRPTKPDPQLRSPARGESRDTSREAGRGRLRRRDTDGVGLGDTKDRDLEGREGGGRKKAEWGTR